MISNDLLSNRLNLFKQGSLKEGPSSSPTSELTYNFIATILSGIWFFAKILIYGYASRLIFNTDWNFINTSLIGSMIIITMTYFYTLIHTKS